MTKYNYKSINGAWKDLSVITKHGNSVKFEIGNDDPARYEFLSVSEDDAVDMALKLIRDVGREDLLATAPYVPMVDRIGTFVRKGDEILRIVGPSHFTSTGGPTCDYAEAAEASGDYAEAADASGDTYHIYNRLVKGAIHWTPVEVEVTPAVPEKWEVAE